MVRIDKLCVRFDDEVAVCESTFSIESGEIVGLVGESGSGKSLTAKAIMGLLNDDATVSGDIYLDNVCISSFSEKEKASYRGDDISMIFQEPMTSLNPLIKVGKQIAEVINLHLYEEKEAVYDRVISVMESVGLKDARKVYNQYPHELSGGMRQRVMIAMAIVLNPKLLIADEPTTALDVNTQEQIIELIKKINVKKKTSVLFITHNLKLARAICDRVVVMKDGLIVEQGTVDEIFENPQEEYTRKLIEAIPKRVKLRQVMESENSSKAE